MVCGEVLRYLRIARQFCRRCISIINRKVETGCGAASRDEPIAVADLSLGGSAAHKQHVLRHMLCTNTYDTFSGHLNVLTPGQVTHSAMGTAAKSEQGAACRGVVQALHFRLAYCLSGIHKASTQVGM